MPPLKILFVSPEVEPFVKAGGLGDMVGALPKELAAFGGGRERHDRGLVGVGTDAPRAHWACEDE